MFLLFLRVCLCVCLDEQHHFNYKNVIAIKIKSWLTLMEESLQESNV